MSKKKIDALENNAEYNLISILDKIGLVFKYSFFLFLTVVLIYGIYIYFFSLEKLIPLSNNNSFKKGVINISFSSLEDYNLSKKYIKNYNSILYNKALSQKIDYTDKFIPLYRINLEERGYFYSLKKDFSEKDILGDDFYILKNKKDESAYRRDNVITPKISELYSGKIVFEQFFNFPYIDFINLISGILFSEQLYQFKYSEKLSKIVLSLMKQKEGFFITSYNNTDRTSHKDLLKAFSIYYNGIDFISSIQKGKYFLANELIVSGKKFDFKINNNLLEYTISYKNKDFKSFIFKDGKRVKISYKNSLKFKLSKGNYRVVILKLETHLFSKTELFAYYFNFKN